MAEQQHSKEFLLRCVYASAYICLHDLPSPSPRAARITRWFTYACFLPCSFWKDKQLNLCFSILLIPSLYSPRLCLHLLIQSITIPICSSSPATSFNPSLSFATSPLRLCRLFWFSFIAIASDKHLAFHAHFYSPCFNNCVSQLFLCAIKHSIEPSHQ